MKIKIINPNTTASMTAKIGRAAQLVANSTTEIITCHPTTGTVSIEGHYDEALSVVGILEEIRQGEAAGMDGYILACFGDPGLLAARELARGPVLGIAEAAMHAASFLSTGFSIITTLDRTKVIARQLVANYGMNHTCRRVRAINLPVLELERPNSPAQQSLLEECRLALREDESGAIVLGCAGMTDLANYLTQELEVPVIDGVTVAVKFLEALISLQLTTSKFGDLAYPIAKPYQGILQPFTSHSQS